MQKRLPVGIQTLENVLRHDVLPDLKRKRNDWQEDLKQFELEQSKLFDELCREKGIKVNA